MNTKHTAVLDHVQRCDQHAHATLDTIHALLLKLCSKLDKQAARKAMRLPDVKAMTGDSRSQIYARMNSKYPAYDPSFPSPFYVGASPRWWEHQIAEWLEHQASLSKKTH